MKLRRLLVVLAAALALISAGSALQLAHAATSESTENSCADGKDNDGDGKIDGNDPDCREQTVRRCSDGIDNDGDGKKDYQQDPGCKGPDDDSEFDLCADGKDNDGDGKVDEADSQCVPGGGGELNIACNDGKDNDGDGATDLGDAGCRDKADQSEKFGCEDGLDNDKDGRIDHPADAGCASATDDSEGGEPALESCADGIDNDRDGLTDADDPDCHEPTPPAACSDTKDNDGDGKIDYPADPGCSSAGDTDETDAAVADPCTTEAQDPGITGSDTVAQQLYDGVLNTLPVVEDPDANGPLSGQIYSGGNGTPVEVLTDELSCAASLPAGDPL
jgi:hypothetical protein